MDNNKGYWNKRDCYVCESRWYVEYLKKPLLSITVNKRFVKLTNWMHFQQRFGFARVAGNSRHVICKINDWNIL